MLTFTHFVTPLKASVYISSVLCLSVASFWAARAQPGTGLLETFADSTRQLTVGQIRNRYDQHCFRPLAGNRLLKNYTTANHWLHLRLPPARSQPLYLEIDNPRLNQVDFYQTLDKAIVSQVITGDSLPFDSRRFSHYNWVFPMLPDARSPTDVFVRLGKQGEILNAPVRVWLPNAFEAYSHRRYLLWGILAGITLVVLLLNGMVWIATSDALYGWFMVVIGLHAFHLGAASGLSFQYLWPDLPIVNDWYPQTISAWLIVLAQVHFMQRFIGQTAQNSRVFRWVNGFKYLIVGATALTVGLLVFRAVPPFYFRLLVALTLFFSLMVVPLAVVSLYERRRRREPIIRFYAGITTLQFGALAAFFVSIAFARAGRPLFTFTNEGLVVVSFLVDLLLLSLGVLYFGFTNYRRQNETLLTTLHQTEQEQSQRIIEALEIERGRIAEDLYDDVGAILSTAIGYVSGVLRRPGIREQFPLLTEARHLLDRAVDNLRTVSHNLMPKNFAELGLAKSLAETIDKVTQANDVRFGYVLAGRERKLDTAVEVQIFRIAAELIQAILTDSTVTSATMQLIYQEDFLRLVAEADGTQIPQYTNLQSKVNFINGTLMMDTGPAGTTTVVEIPYS